MVRVLEGRVLGVGYRAMVLGGWMLGGMVIGGWVLVARVLEGKGSWG